jgi:hypothetical protein
LTQLGWAAVRDQRDPRRELPLACAECSDLIPTELRLGDRGAQRESRSGRGAEVVGDDVTARRLRQPLHSPALHAPQPRKHPGVDDGTHAGRQLGEQYRAQVTGIRSSRP